MDRKSIILAGLAVVFAAACTKSPAEEKTGEEIISGTAIPVSLEVSIGNENPETRLTYELDGAGTALKSTWNKGDRISLVTYDQNYKLMGNDVLTAESSGTSVKFKGTYTCPERVGSSLRVGISIIYPAFSGDPLSTAAEPASSNGYYTVGPFYIKDRLLCLDADRKFIQYSDGNLSNLPYYTLMTGSVDRDDFLETGKFAATMHHKTYIIKAELTLPRTHPDGTSDYTITSVKIQTEAEAPKTSTTLVGYGEMGFLQMDFAKGKSYMQTYLRKIRSDGVVMGISCPRSSKVTVYFIGGLYSEAPKFFADVDYLKITAYHLDENLEEKTLTATKQFKKGLIMTDGYIYTISADLN